MSSLTIASWADSGIIKRDKLDTCVVEVRKNGYVFSYSIDMRKGLIIASVALTPGAEGSSSHFYLYGEHAGIYYIRKVCSFPDSSADTTINSGGYDFYNIRVNDEPVTPVINLPRAMKSPFAIRAMDKNGMRAIYIGDNKAVRIAAYDLLGRRHFSMINGKETDIVRLDRVCPSGRCPSGNVIIRMQTRESSAYSAFVVR
jgi:hypothetical protein